MRWGPRVRLDGSTTISTVRDGQNIMAMPDRSTRQVRVGDFGIALADGAGRLHATLNDDFARVVLEIAPDEGRYYYEYNENNVQKAHVSLDRKRSVSESLRYGASGLLQVRTLAGCAERLHYDGALLPSQSHHHHFLQRKSSGLQEAGTFSDVVRKSKHHLIPRKRVRVRPSFGKAGLNGGPSADFAHELIAFWRTQECKNFTGIGLHGVQFI